MSAVPPPHPAARASTGLPRPRFSPRVRAWLIGICTLSSALFGWVELRVAPHPFTTLGLACAALGALHAATAVCAAFVEPWLGRTWQLLAWTSLVCALVFTGATSGASVELVEMYGPLGWGLAVLLAAITLLLLTATVPVALWGLWLLGAGRSAR